MTKVDDLTRLKHIQIASKLIARKSVAGVPPVELIEQEANS